MTPGREQRYPTWWQALLIVAAGAVIGVSSCAGFLGSLNFSGGQTNGILGILFASGFVAGVLGVLGGFVLLLIAVARGMVHTSASPQTVPVAPSDRPSLGLSVSKIRTDSQRDLLRQLQIALVVMMILGSASLLQFLFGPRSHAFWKVLLVRALIAYALTQIPYLLALARMRRGPDRLGVAIAFSAGCILCLRLCLFLFRFGLRPGFPAFSESSLIMGGHAVVAILSWRLSRLLPSEKRDWGLVAGGILGVIAYLELVQHLVWRLLPMHFW